MRELRANGTEALLARRDEEADEFQEETNDKDLPRVKCHPKKKKILKQNIRICGAKEFLHLQTRGVNRKSTLDLC